LLFTSPQATLDVKGVHLNGSVFYDVTNLTDIVIGNRHLPEALETALALVKVRVCVCACVRPSVSESFRPSVRACVRAVASED
jgi:hypothetical protein